MRRQKAHLVSLLFLCVAYINKSIYIYELAVEFCIFESSIIILKKLAGRIHYPALFRDLTIYRSSSAYNIC